jgi:hypothetical protein
VVEVAVGRTFGATDEGSRAMEITEKQARVVAGEIRSRSRYRRIRPGGVPARHGSRFEHGTHDPETNVTDDDPKIPARSPGRT